MVDPDTGHVYQTEDSNSCGFYKFIPNVPGDSPEARSHMPRSRTRRTSIWPGLSAWNSRDVEWVIGDPTAAVTSTYQTRGSAGGVSLAEAPWGDTTGFFLDGRRVVREGQVFEYDPSAETLKPFTTHRRSTISTTRQHHTSRRAADCRYARQRRRPRVVSGGERLVGLTLAGETSPSPQRRRFDLGVQHRRWASNYKR